MIEITTTVREAVAKLRRIPRRLEGAAMDFFNDATEEIRRIMSRPGLPPVYPLDWDSPEQQRFVMAKLREENDLPYTRKNTHVNAWTSGPIANGYQVANLGTKAVFLFGSPSGALAGATKVQPSGQSHLFKGRWRLIRPVIEAVLSRMPKGILEKFRVLVNG